MKLYGFPPSPNTWKIRAVAAHLGLPLEVEFVDLTKGAQRVPEYLALNPVGRTPTLVDGDFVLWESAAILQYIADKKPNTLWPNDPRTRADISRWLFWNLAHWGGESCQPLIFQRLVKKIMNMGGADAAAVEQATQCFNREAGLLEGQLAKQPYLVGTGLTLADFSIAAPLFYAKEAELPVANYPRCKSGSAASLHCRPGMRLRRWPRRRNTIAGAAVPQRVGTGFSPR
jgi:glutathione S-transferase